MPLNLKVAKNNWFWFLLILDWLTKLLFRRLELFSANTGMGLGLLTSFPWPVLLLSLAALLALGLKAQSVGIKLMILGGLGNLADRLIFGAVTDWLHLGDLIWFNLADIYIVTGLVLIVLEGKIERYGDKNPDHI